MDFLIREAAEQDYAGMNALFEEIDEYHRKALPQTFRKQEGQARTREFVFRVIADQNAVIFIAEMQNEIIGLAYAYVRTIPELAIRIPCRAGEVDQLIVHEKYRRCGVGKALMKRIDQWAGQMKLDRLELSVWNFNEAAREFYLKLGYEHAFIRLWKQNV